MVELIKFVIGSFAEKKDEINYDVVDNGKDVKITVTVADSDMGKVIGRQGKIAKALRTLIKAGSMKEGKRYILEIKEKNGD